MVRAVRAPTGPLEWGIATRPLPGQSSSGDTSFIRPVGDGLLAGVIDALGHGAEAAAAAQKAVDTIDRNTGEPIPSLVKRCHAELVGTRGVVMGIAAFHLREPSVEWLGVGNVEGVLVSADPRAQPRCTALVSRGGIVGADLPKVSPWVVPLNPGDTLIFSTDGVRPGFAAGVTGTESPQVLADRILSLYAKETDDALILAIRYCGDA